MLKEVQPNSRLMNHNRMLGYFDSREGLTASVSSEGRSFELITAQMNLNAIGVYGNAVGSISILPNAKTDNIQMGIGCVLYIAYAGENICAISYDGKSYLMNILEDIL